MTDEHDPLRSEGRAYARKLRRSGVDVEARDYRGVMHEFFGMTAVVRKARVAVDRAASDLRAAARRAAGRDQ